MPGTESIPKKIWMMWLQGIDQAPKVVKSCHHSWVKRNPDWEVIVVDSTNYAEYSGLDGDNGFNSTDIPTPALSDIVRINLLAKHGGVWVDATCFCVKPLDEWIEQHAAGGFFCYLGHRKDTIVSSWFLASRLENHLTLALRDIVNAYWRDNQFPFQRNSRIYTVLKKLINWHPRLTGLWFSWLVRKPLKMWPYFWFHYLFAELIKQDKLSSTIWDQVIKLDAVVPHRVQSWGLVKPLTIEAKRIIDRQEDLVYKLNWKLHKFDAKCDGNNFPADSHLQYVLDSVDSSPV